MRSIAWNINGRQGRCMDAEQLADNAAKAEE
jgi:hypothetical protein